jgi:hypothetical protein
MVRPAGGLARNRCNRPTIRADTLPLKESHTAAGFTTSLY